jgi:hypothetical protein
MVNTVASVAKAATNLGRDRERIATSDLSWASHATPAAWPLR